MGDLLQIDSMLEASCSANALNEEDLIRILESVRGSCRH